MSEPVKRGRGRPRKTEPVQTKPTNPDCEPATKGYVKCVARTLVDRMGQEIEANGVNSDPGNMLIISSLGFVFAWMLAMFVRTEPVAAWASGCSAIVLLICGHEVWAHDHHIHTCKSYEIRSIQKYTPVCEEKKECE